jgi:hypothetical protein
MLVQTNLPKRMASFGGSDLRCISFIRLYRTRCDPSITSVLAGFGCSWGDRGSR